jgi:ring-1,2-phenylacetyl-CoA epoxidase subunit PaaE
MTPKFHTLRISDIRKETEDTVSIAFDSPQTLMEDYHFLAGQYLTLRTSIQGEDVRRSYSLCSAPFEKEFRVAVKQVENGLFSTFANHELKIGDALDVMTPMGNFALKPNPESKKSYALFAAGSGITPVLSLTKTILKEEPHNTVTLFYGNKNFNSIIFREELEALKNKYMDRLRIIHVLSRESLGNQIQKGRIDRDKCNALYNAFLKNEGIDSVYVCGPEEMILGVKESMTEQGIDPRNIHFELFNTTKSEKNNNTKSETKQSTSIDSTVSIILDGDTIDLELNSSGETILDAAQKAGADLPFACKGGVCCTCKAKIIQGSASMDVNYALEKDEVEAGYILTCQAHPTSEKLIVSFDE